MQCILNFEKRTVSHFEIVCRWNVREQAMNTIKINYVYQFGVQLIDGCDLK